MIQKRRNLIISMLIWKLTLFPQWLQPKVTSATFHNSKREFLYISLRLQRKNRRIGHKIQFHRTQETDNRRVCVVQIRPRCNNRLRFCRFHFTFDRKSDNADEARIPSAARYDHWNRLRFGCVEHERERRDRRNVHRSLWHDVQQNQPKEENRKMHCFVSLHRSELRRIRRFRILRQNIQRYERFRVVQRCSGRTPE